MSTDTEAPKKWRKRLLRFTIIGSLMGVSFGAGVAVTATVAVLMLVPFAATGLTIGLAGMAAASVNATANTLYTGDSASRLTILTYLKQSFAAQATQPIDPQLSAWILPAVEQCKTDSDPVVVDLATELADYITDNTAPPPP
jgi:hypothetical protein